jgi:hypothetical protein
MRLRTTTNKTGVWVHLPQRLNASSYKYRVLAEGARYPGTALFDIDARRKLWHWLFSTSPCCFNRLETE